MSIDDRIQKELMNEASDIDDLLVDRQGIVGLGMDAFRGGLRRWVVLITVIIVLVSALMVWCGYRFYIAQTVDDRVFWGVWLVVSLIAQVGFKQWTWMEARRVAMLREVKRVEIAVERLASSIQDRQSQG